jgi:ADP-ribosylarginine hydrolase
MLHGGDNDSTGCIAGSWYGALHGFNGVPRNNYEVKKIRSTS